MKSNAVILDDSVPVDCLEKVVHHETGAILYQKIRSSPRLPQKVTLKSVWQDQQESTGKPVADQVTIKPAIDLKFQGATPEEPQQEEKGSQKLYILENLCVQVCLILTKMHWLPNCKATIRIHHSAWNQNT